MKLTKASLGKDLKSLKNKKKSLTGRQRREINSFCQRLISTPVLISTTDPSDGSSCSILPCSGSFLDKLSLIREQINSLDKIKNQSIHDFFSY